MGNIEIVFLIFDAFVILHFNSVTHTANDAIVKFSRLLNIPEILIHLFILRLAQACSISKIISIIALEGRKVSITRKYPSSRHLTLNIQAVANRILL